MDLTTFDPGASADDADMTWAGEDVLPLSYTEEGYLTDESYRLAHIASAHDSTGSYNGICRKCRVMLMNDDGAEPCTEATEAELADALARALAEVSR